MASPQPAGNPAPERRDYRKEVTESIIQMLEQGVAPWQKPWDAATVGNLAVPFNPTSNNPYRGGNAIYLMASAIRKGFDDPRWMTYKPAAANDWQVRGGEKGTQIEFWEKRSEGKDGQKRTENETPQQHRKHSEQRRSPRRCNPSGPRSGEQNRETLPA